MIFVSRFPSRLRVSIGSAILLGLLDGRMDVNPTTIYLLTYNTGKCSANCAFCPQARTSTSRPDMLARVIWPHFSTIDIIKRIAIISEKKLISRVCIQAINYPSMFNNVYELVKKIGEIKIPISISCQPLNDKKIRLFAEAGVDRIGISLDLPTKSLFERIKGILSGSPYVWEEHLKTLDKAVNIFGKGRVVTHLIVGLGEKDKELIYIFQKMVNKGIYPSLFAFTPIKGTRLEKRSPPSIQRYRRIQLAHHFITKGIVTCKEMEFDDEGNLVFFGVNEEILIKTIRGGRAFITSGCPGCNRPFYNEGARGPIYNFPKKPKRNESILIEKQIMGV